MKKNYLSLVLIFVFFLQASSQNTELPEIWSFQSNGPIFSIPSVSRESVFIGSLDSNVYCINSETGKLRWKYKTMGAIRNSILVTDRLIYGFSMDGMLYALDPNNGNLIWKKWIATDKQYDYGDWKTSSPVTDGNLIIMGAADSSVYALDMNTGTTIWKTKLRGIIHATPSLTNKEIMIGDFGGYMYCLEKESGKIKWEFRSVGHRFFPIGEFQGDPVAGNSVVMAAGRDYNIYALNIQTGRSLWNHSFPLGWALGNTILRDSCLYVTTSDDKVLAAYSLSSGRELWRTNMDFNMFAPLFVHNNEGYLGTLLGKFYKVDLKSGSKELLFTTKGYQQFNQEYFSKEGVWSNKAVETFIKDISNYVQALYKLGSFFSAPLITENNIYITSLDGKLYCLKKK